VALDSRQKRTSAQQILLPWRVNYPDPDGSLAAGDRQHITLSYSGILAAAASEAVAAAVKAVEDLWRRRKHIFWDLPDGVMEEYIDGSGLRRKKVILHRS